MAEIRDEIASRLDNELRAIKIEQGSTKPKAIATRAILTCNDNFDILKDHVITYKETIEEMTPFEVFLAEGGADEYDLIDARDCVLMPALCNPHVHLEFTDNKGLAFHKGFGAWLDTIMDKGATIDERLIPAIMDNISSMQASGTGYIGAISSYGVDIDALRATKMPAVVYSEIMGADKGALDRLKARLKKCEGIANITKAIGIHSPYSLSKELALDALDIAKREGLRVQAHYLESKEEREWLDRGSGFFKGFFMRHFKVNATPYYKSALEFLDIFSDKGIEHLALTHCLEASEEECEKIARLKASIITAPRSNELLCGRLLMPVSDALNDITLGLATDGLSSNTSLSLFDEMRFLLDTRLPSFLLALDTREARARYLLWLATRKNADILGFHAGRISLMRDASFAVFNHADKEITAEALISNAKKVDHLIIRGEKVI